MALAGWKDPALEQRLREEIGLEEPWALIERFSTLVRESGSEDERLAAQYLSDRLDAFGVPHVVHRPTLFISVPKQAAVRIRTAGGAMRELAAKTVSMSVATGDQWREAPLVYVPMGHASSVETLFETGEVTVALDGKIALAEGLPMPAKVQKLQERGAVAAVFVSPGERIHEGTCTTIWGAPDLDNWQNQPRIPVAELSHSDGTALIAQVQSEPLQAAVQTQLEEGWMPCPVVVAEIEGAADPQNFVLLHGHYDSWHVGIGDNATGDATLLEIARSLWRLRASLRRSVRICWWPGHSTGRYAGSTWYADTFAHDLEDHAIASVNCDSPGCRWAEEFRGLTAMSTLYEMTRSAIADSCGVEATWERPVRAGDYSFNNLGLPATLMLSSTMPLEVARAKGYYAVGGCGGNIAWHTEDDTLEIADRDLLLRDIRVYATVVSRLANAPLHPFDLGATTDEMSHTIDRYQEAAGDRFDLRPARDALASLAAVVGLLDERPEPGDDLQACAAINEALREASRLLVRVNYARAGAYRQEPALEVPALPDLQVAELLAQAGSGSHREHVIRTHLTRGQNRLVGSLRRAERILRRAIG